MARGRAADKIEVVGVRPVRRVDVQRRLSGSAWYLRCSFGTATAPRSQRPDTQRGIEPCEPCVHSFRAVGSGGGMHPPFDGLSESGWRRVACRSPTWWPSWTGRASSRRRGSDKRRRSYRSVAGEKIDTFELAARATLVGRRNQRDAEDAAAPDGATRERHAAQPDDPARVGRLPAGRRLRMSRGTALKESDLPWSFPSRAMRRPGGKPAVAQPIIRLCRVIRVRAVRRGPRHPRPARSAHRKPGDLHEAGRNSGLPV
jgi:hypothetical protein